MADAELVDELVELEPVEELVLLAPEPVEELVLLVPESVTEVALTVPLDAVLPAIET